MRLATNSKAVWAEANLVQARYQQFLHQRGSMHIAFIDSWLQNVAEGSGTAAGIGGLQQALLARGHHVARLAPPRAWPRTMTARRLLFNLHLPALLRRLRYDLVVGFD